MEHELEQWKQQTVIAPVEVPNIAVGMECEDALLELVQSKATISEVLMIDASKGTLAMNNSTPEVGVKNEVTLTQFYQLSRVSLDYPGIGSVFQGSRDCCKNPGKMGYGPYPG